MRIKRTLFLALAGLGVATTLASAAHAQTGFALKGHYIVNASSARTARDSAQVPHADAFGLGAEFVLPFGIGVGVSGYTASQKSGTAQGETREFTLLGEANYFLRLPLLPVAPYAGVHAGLGNVTRETVASDPIQLQDKTRSQLGYQVGVRVQLSPLVGLDGQWRHMSTSAVAGQDSRLERNQVLVGVTLF